MLISGYDFGYVWPWTHGHLVPAVLFGLMTLLAWRYRWRRTTIGLSALSLWALAGFVVVQAVFRINRPLLLPTRGFLSSGSGRVLDAGAGSGRSALMVLLSRPGARVVALDDFSATYIADHGPGRLHANARAAGVDDRVEVQVGDMRSMPLESESFDAAVSASAIDHLNSEGIARALAEVARVLRPGGEFLLINANPDFWTRLAYPFFHGHTYYGRAPAVERWRKRLTTAGFNIVEQGTRPATLYFLCRKG